MAHKTRVQRITENDFLQVKGLISKFPSATNAQIGKLFPFGGGLSAATVGIIRKCNDYQDYLDFNKKKFSKAEGKDELIDTGMGIEGEFIPLSKIAQDYKNEKIAELLLQIVDILKN